MLHTKYNECSWLADLPHTLSVEDTHRFLDWISIPARNKELRDPLAESTMLSLIKRYETEHDVRFTRHEIAAYRQLLTLFTRYARY